MGKRLEAAKRLKDLELKKEEEEKVKRSIRPPSAPESFRVCDWGQDFCTVRWQPPKENGGAGITGYTVEVLEKGFHEWREGLNVNGSTTEGTVKPPVIVMRREYMFRVVASNESGTSVPSNQSEIIKIKNRFVRPKIDRSSSWKRTVKANTAIKIDAKFEGEPLPKVTWYSPSGGMIEQNDTFSIETFEYHTCLVIRRSQRTDTGYYKLLVENEAGSDSAEIEVTVISPPSEPMGPLNVEDVTSTSCHLSWKAPKDNGGDTINYYLLEKKENKNNIWSPCGKTLTSQIDITDLHTGLDYLFRVKAVNGEGEGPVLRTSDTTTAKDPFSPPTEPLELAVTSVGAKWVKLSWKPPSNDGGAHINNYVVEKKDPLTKTYAKVTETLTGETFITVNGLRESSKNQFRVRAGNKAGLGVPSVATDAIECIDYERIEREKKEKEEEERRKMEEQEKLKAEREEQERRQKEAEARRKQEEQALRQKRELQLKKEQLEEQRKKEKEKLRLEKEKRMEEEKQKLIQQQKEAEEKKQELEKRQAEREKERRDRLLQAQMQLDKEREEIDAKRRKAKEEKDRQRKEEMEREKAEQEKKFMEEQERMKMEREMKVKERNEEK